MAAGDAWARLELVRGLSSENDALVRFFASRSTAEVREALLACHPNRRLLAIDLTPDDDLVPHVQLTRGIGSTFSRSAADGVMVPDHLVDVLRTAGDVKRVGSTVATEGWQWRGIQFPKDAPFIELPRQVYEAVLPVEPRRTRGRREGRAGRARPDAPRDSRSHEDGAGDPMKLGSPEAHFSQLMRRMVVLEHQAEDESYSSNARRWKRTEADAIDWAIRRLAELDPSLEPAIQAAEGQVAAAYDQKDAR